MKNKLYLLLLSFPFILKDLGGSYHISGIDVKGVLVDNVVTLCSQNDALQLIVLDDVQLEDCRVAIINFLSELPTTLKGRGF